MGGAVRTCVQVLVGVNSFYPDFRTSYIATYINTYQHTYVQTSVHTYVHTCMSAGVERDACVHTVHTGIQLSLPGAQQHLSLK